jgi:hypothetical protein
MAARVTLAVDVAYSNDQLSLPDPVVIPAGSASVEVEVPIWPSVTISLVPGAGYTVASDSSTFDVQVVTAIGDLGCNLQGIAEVRQVVEVGQVPATIDLNAQGIGVNEPPSLDIAGSQPPGALLQRDGSWRGATTNVGIHRATAYYCDAGNWCPQALKVVVEVVDHRAPENRRDRWLRARSVCRAFGRIGFRAQPGGEFLGECGLDLDVPQEEGALVEPLPAHPCRDLVVALARIAGTAGRRDVGEGVPPPTRKREHAIPLQRFARLAAVGAATPGLSERLPLLVAEIVLDARHPGFASPSGPRPTGAIYRHGTMVGTDAHARVGRP